MSLPHGYHIHQLWSKQTKRPKTSPTKLTLHLNHVAWRVHAAHTVCSFLLQLAVRLLLRGTYILARPARRCSVSRGNPPKMQQLGRTKQKPTLLDTGSGGAGVRLPKTSIASSSTWSLFKWCDWKLFDKKPMTQRFEVWSCKTLSTLHICPWEMEAPRLFPAARVTWQDCATVWTWNVDHWNEKTDSSLLPSHFQEIVPQIPLTVVIQNLHAFMEWMPMPTHTHEQIQSRSMCFFSTNRSNQNDPYMAQ